MSDRSPSPAPKDHSGDDANENRSRSPSPRRASRSRSPAANNNTGSDDNTNENGNGNGSLSRDNGDRDERRESSSAPLDNPGNNVYVANLPLRMTEPDLEETFGKFGALQKCEVILDPVTRESRGFAFVTYEDVRDAEDAVKEMHGKELQGRRLRVEIAKRRRGHEKTPGKYLGPRQASAKYGRERHDSRDRGTPRDRSRGRDRGGRSRSRDRDRSRSRGRRYDDRSRYDDRRRDDRGRGRSYDRYDDRRSRR